VRAYNPPAEGLMSKPIKRECPHCYTSRTMLDASFALPGLKHTPTQKPEDCLNEECVLPVHILLCPSCHLIELYHDVGDNLPMR